VKRGGRPFTKVGVRRLLANVVYAGQVSYRGEVHAGAQPALVEMAVWRKVQALLRRQRRGLRSEAQARPGGPTLLAGRLWCAACGTALTSTHTTGAGGRRYRYYRCPAGRRACPAKAVPAAALERFVSEQVRRLGRDAAWQRALQDAARGQDAARKAALVAQCRELEQDLARRHAALQKQARKIRAGQDHGVLWVRLAELQEPIAPLEERLRAARGQLAACEAPVRAGPDPAPVLAALDAVWETLPADRQARAVELLVERVDYDAATGQVKVAFQAGNLRALAAELVRPRPEIDP
jgi:site-specific DNA recombinase